MDRYKEYSLEDFVLDARFQDWVRYKRQDAAVSWDNYLKKNPSQQKDIEQAQILLESVYSHFKTHLNDADIDYEIQQLLSKVRAEKNNDTIPETQILKVSWQRPVVNKSAVFWVAAVIILTFGLAWLYSGKLHPKSDYVSRTAEKGLKEVVNETGTDKIITLSDGSKLILKPDSRISYPEIFLPDKREVYLSGEASFKVSKDPKRPFLVYANELITKVLGTSFTINAHNKTQKTTVEVTEGKVSVFRQTDFSETKNQKVLQSKGVVLTTNQKLVFEEESSNMIKTLREKPEIVESDEIPKTFNFVNVPASTVLSDLRDAYQVDIIFDKELLQDCPVTASISRQSLFQKLDIICEVIEAHYEMLDGRIVVYSKGCKN